MSATLVDKNGAPIKKEGTGTIIRIVPVIVFVTPPRPVQVTVIRRPM